MTTPLPARPKNFDTAVAYELTSEDWPARDSYSEPGMETWELGGVEWTWGPGRERVVQYLLQDAEDHWVLWLADQDPDYGQPLPVACCKKHDVSAEAAAVYLLAAYWAFDRDQGLCKEPFHAITFDDFLTGDQIDAVSELVWKRS